MVLLFLNLIPQYGQSISSEVEKINKVIAKTTSDTILCKVVYQMDLENGKKMPKQINIFFKDDQISKISICYNCNSNNFLNLNINGGIFIYYFLENGELCFIRHQNLYYSRPGSCGYINIIHGFYFKNNKLLKSDVDGYNPCEPLGKSNNDNYLAEVQLNNFKSLYDIIRNKKPLLH